MAIQVVRNSDGNCITFRGSSNPVYFNACLSAVVDSVNDQTINVINDIATAGSVNTVYEFFQIPYTEFRDSDNNPFADAAATANYITANGNVLTVDSAQYLGVWDADANLPDISATTPTSGDFYYVSTPGSTSLDGVSTWRRGDRVLYNGTEWQKLAATNILGQATTTILSNTQAAVFADGEAGTADPNNAPGWYYTNTENNKINWYFYGDTPHVVNQLGDLNGFYAVVDFKNTTSRPYFSVYTRMENDGNDGGVWYRTRRNYLDESEYGSALTATGRYLVHTVGLDVSSIEPTLPRIALGQDSVSADGPNAGTEEISYMALSTSSGLPAGQEEFIVEKIALSLGDYASEFLLTAPPTTGHSAYDTTPTNLDFQIDATNTTILSDDGEQWGVNSLRAVGNGDGTIHIETVQGNVIRYESVAFGNITITGTAAGSNEANTVNALNALFQVQPLGQGGDYAPTYPVIDAAAITSTDAEGLTPTTTKSDGTTLHLMTVGTDTGGHGARLWSTESIDTAGEYYLVKVTGNGRFIIGFADDSSDDLTELANNSGSSASGLIWSQAFYDYGSYTAPWTWYGSSSSGSYGPGWTGATTGMMRYNNNVQTAMSNPNNSDGVLFKAGIDSQGYLAVWYYDEGRSNDFILCSRRSLTTDGANNYHLVVKLWNGNATLVEQPERVAVDDAAPVLNYRYIESPDGVFHYPLFASAEEAEYVDTANGGSGQSTSEIFVDEPTMTTWYSPVTGYTDNAASAPANTAEITYAVIATSADSNYVPSDLTLSDHTFAENASVNIPVQPMDQVPVAIVSGLPGGLVFQGGSIVGTTRYVTGDQTYTVTVERTNVFGTNTQSFDLTITDNASLNTVSGWVARRADQIAYQPDHVPHYSPESTFDFDLTLDEDTEFTWTQTNGAHSSSGGPGQFLQIGIVTSGVDKSTAALGNTSNGWDLKAVIWTDRANHTSTDTGWVSGATLYTGNNDGAVWKLSHEEDPVHGSNHHIVLYRDGVEVARSADHYNGSQTITVAVPENYSSNFRLPGISKTNIGAGSTTPPAGFVDPLTSGQMNSTTVLGNGADAAALLTDTLEPGKRYVFPQTWVEANILPNFDSGEDKVFFGIPKTTATLSNVTLSDFDMVARLQQVSNTQHKSLIWDNGSNDDEVTINSGTDAFYDYALEWDGVDLHVIACNVNDINTQPGIGNGGSFSRVISHTSFTEQTGNLPLAIAVNEFGQVGLTTTGLQKIDIPYGANDILVSEISETECAFDVGSGPVNPSQVTLNAGYTYRFMLNNASIESGDTLSFALISTGNPYTTGVTTVGSHGDYLHYVEFQVPSNVPPIKVKWNGTDSGAVQISGSTYVTPVTGITTEGPAANFTGNVINSGAGNHGWVSVDETLGAGQRLVMDNAFLTDLVSAMPNGSYVYVGIKGPSWDNDVALDTYSPIFIVGKLTDSDVRLNFTGASQVYTSLAALTSSGQQAFLEITNSGDNVRGAYGPQDASTVAYADWTSGAKNQTGDQGYGLTTGEVGIMCQMLAGNTTGFDVTDVDWTGLSEVSVPTAAVSLTTPWTKALDFSGSSERCQQVDSGSNYAPLKMGNVSAQVSAHSTQAAGTWTSDGTNSRPWATAVVFSSDNNASNQHIWNLGEGSGSTDDNIYLRVASNRQVYFGWGRTGALNECYLGTLSSGAGTWYGFYIAHTGERLSGGDATAANLANCFHIRGVNLTTGAVGSEISTSNNWGTNGGRMDRQFTGEMTIGGRGSNRSFHGKVASMVVTTLLRDQQMPQDAEISMMVRDPQQWMTDHKVGQNYRAPWLSGETVSWQKNSSTPAYSTQVWLMGDGASDAYSKIRNNVYPAVQNIYPLNMISMVSNDIQTVNITGLS